jgi:D-alanyl-D-alanine carboxypeptidase
MKRLLLLTSLALACCVGLMLFRSHTATAPSSQAQPAAQATPTASPTATPQAFDKTKHSIDQPGSIWWIVNKTRPVGATYVPAEIKKPNVILNSQKQNDELSLAPEAAGALELMFQAADQEDVVLMLASGYRSYSRQTTYYNSLVSSLGQSEADRVSARPGTSEHQTGLSLDIARPDRSCYLQTCFTDTIEGKWLAANAYKYGYLLRYPSDKEQVTGYAFEPWHFRYIGVDLSTELHSKNVTTLEEYFGL